MVLEIIEYNLYLETRRHEDVSCLVTTVKSPHLGVTKCYLIQITTSGPPVCNSMNQKLPIAASNYQGSTRNLGKDQVDKIRHSHFYLWINFLQGRNPTWVKILREVPTGTHLSWEHKTFICLSLQSSNCLWMRRVLQRNIWDQVSWNVEVKSLEFSKEEARIPRRSWNDKTRWCLSCPGASEAPREGAWGGGLAKMQLLSDLKPVPEKSDAFMSLAFL